MTRIEETHCDECALHNNCENQSSCMELKHWANGYKSALEDIERVIDYATVNKKPFIVLHIRDFIDKMIERKGE